MVFIVHPAKESGRLIHTHFMFFYWSLWGTEHELSIGCALCAYRFILYRFSIFIEIDFFLFHSFLRQVLARICLCRPASHLFDDIVKINRMTATTKAKASNKRCPYLVFAFRFFYVAIFFFHSFHCKFCCVVIFFFLSPSSYHFLISYTHFLMLFIAFSILHSFLFL